MGFAQFSTTISKTQREKLFLDKKNIPKLRFFTQQDNVVSPSCFAPFPEYTTVTQAWQTEAVRNPTAT